MVHYLFGLSFRFTTGKRRRLGARRLGLAPALTAVALAAQATVGPGGAPPAQAADFTVTVGPGLNYSPSSLTIAVGDTVFFVFADGLFTVTHGTSCTKSSDALFDFASNASFTFTAPGVYPYFSAVENHCQQGMTGVITVTAVDTTPPVLSLPPSLMVDATSAAGAVVNYTATATDAVDGPVPVTCSPASGSTFAIGTSTVNCSASDFSGNLAHDSFTVEVKSAATQLDDQITVLQALTIPEPLKRNLVRKLEMAKSFAAGGNITVACNQLRAYTNEINGLAESGQPLTVTQATELRDNANRIRAVLGC